MSTKTAHIGAKVSREVFEIVDNAAAIRGWPRSKVVELGALKQAQDILEQAMGAKAALRRLARQNTARAGGLAKAAKRRNH